MGKELQLGFGDCEQSMEKKETKRGKPAGNHTSRTGSTSFDTR